MSLFDRLQFGAAFTSVTRATRRTRSTWAEIVQVADVLRAPLFVALIGVIVFAIPGQTIEIYRLFAEDFSLPLFREGISGPILPAGMRLSDLASAPNIRILSFFILLWVLGYAIWYVARVLTLTIDEIHTGLSEKDMSGRAARWAPRLLGGAPAFGAAIGMWRAASDAEPVLRLFALAALMIGVGRIWSAWWRTKRDPGLYDDLRRTWFEWERRIALSLMLAAVVVVLIIRPIALSQAFGALSLLCLFLIALAFGMSQLTYLYDKHAFPAITLLIAAAIGFSALDINDNHYIRQLRRDAALQQPPAPERAELSEAFGRWWASRKDLSAFQEAGKPYPVYIVAAQGGGLYAAYQSAMFLARMQDSCPNFAQHVFAISGVSGGAVGSTLFTALADKYAQNAPLHDAATDPCNELLRAHTPSFEDATREILKKDFLSPLLASTLFADFSARFLPFPVRRLDRSLSLEIAFERAFEAGVANLEGGGANDVNPLEKGLLSYWRADSAAPALMINTTITETGRRLILSPVKDLGPNLGSYADLAYPARDGAAPDMRLSTAMILSARFPYITPAGSVNLKPTQPGAPVDEPNKVRLVDGGYFENSGADTALQIIRAIRKSVRANRRAARAAGEETLGRIDLRLIVFDLTEDRYRAPSYGLGELLSPVRAILNARSSRSALAQAHARDLLGADECVYLESKNLRAAGSAPTCAAADVANSRVWSVSLNDYKYDFELGWILSRETLDRVERQLGHPARCGRMSLFGASQEKMDAETKLRREEDDAIGRHNSCVGNFILRQLRRQEPPAHRRDTQELLRRLAP